MYPITKYVRPQNVSNQKYVRPLHLIMIFRSQNGMQYISNKKYVQSQLTQKCTKLQNISEHKMLWIEINTLTYYTYSNEETMLLKSC